MRDQNALTALPKRRSRPANSSSASRRSPRAEVGPERVGEHELGVRRLPEHEVRDPPLTGGADQQVDVRQLGRIEPRGDRVLVDVRRRDAVGDQPARGVDELVPAAVVEGDPEVERVEVGGRRSSSSICSQTGRGHGRAGR